MCAVSFISTFNFRCVFFAQKYSMFSCRMPLQGGRRERSEADGMKRGEKRRDEVRRGKTRRGETRQDRFSLEIHERNNGHKLELRPRKAPRRKGTPNILREIQSKKKEKRLPSLSLHTETVRVETLEPASEQRCI